MKLYLAMYRIGAILLVVTIFLTIFGIAADVETVGEQKDFVPVGLAEEYELSTNSPGRLHISISKYVKEGEDPIRAEIWEGDERIVSFNGKYEKVGPFFFPTDTIGIYEIEEDYWLSHGGEYTIKLYGLRSKDSYSLTYEPLYSIISTIYLWIGLPILLILTISSFFMGGMFHLLSMKMDEEIDNGERPNAKGKWKPILSGIINIIVGSLNAVLMIIILVFFLLVYVSFRDFGWIDSPVIGTFCFIIFPFLVIIILSLTQVIGGIYALRRKYFKNVLIMTGSGILRDLVFCIGFLIIGSLILKWEIDARLSLVGWVPAGVFGILTLFSAAAWFLLYRSRLNFRSDSKGTERGDLSTS